MVTKIGPSKPIRHFLKEWRKHRGLTQQQLADRLPTGDDGKPTGKDVISRWERDERGISLDVQVALADALSIDPADLFRDPATPSADELLRSASPETRRAIFAVIETMLKSA
jgi:transcriptional regulator with XRE-family HTH domain